MLCAMGNALLSAEPAWQSGYVNFRDGYQVNAEYSVDINGNYYIRQGKVGRVFEKGNVKSVVGKDYIELINSSSPAKSSFESILFLRSGSTYTLQANQEKQSKDMLALWLKTSSIALSIFFYQDTVGKQNEVKNSTYLIDFDQKRSQFISAKNNLNLSLGILILITAYYAIDAFVYFDSDSKGEKTNTYKASNITLEDYLKIQFPEVKNGAFIDRVNSGTLITYKKSFIFDF